MIWRSGWGERQRPLKTAYIASPSPRLLYLEAHAGASLLCDCGLWVLRGPRDSFFDCGGCGVSW